MMIMPRNNLCRAHRTRDADRGLISRGDRRAASGAWYGLYGPVAEILRGPPGDTVYAEVKVVDNRRGQAPGETDCNCAVDGKKVLIGEAMVLAPSRKFD
ncbi:UNVERIFIED_CONTAM: hypothetical protein GTU68_045020 [Idotea baltica]|nr:hypothetical protein [Idotea baltica]